MTTFDDKTELVVSLLELPADIAVAHHSPTAIEGLDRFWDPSRGGDSVLVDDTLEFLIYPSSVDPEAAVSAWREGTRTRKE